MIHLRHLLQDAGARPARGYMVLPPGRDPVAATAAKQAADLHTASLTQRAVAALFETFDFDAHLMVLCSAYGERRTATPAALDRYMPPGTGWTQPAGGMFTWVGLPGGLRAEDLFHAALEAKVAFVPGTWFFSAQPRYDTLRLNYSNRPSDLIDDGMARLGRVVERAVAARG